MCILFGCQMSSYCLQSTPDYSKVPNPTPILTISFNPKWLIDTQPCSSYITLTFIIPVLYKQPERCLLMFLSNWRPVLWAAVVIDSSIIYTVLRFNLVMQYMRENPPLNVMLSEIFVFDLLNPSPPPPLVGYWQVWKAPGWVKGHGGGGTSILSDSLLLLHLLTDRSCH